MQFLKKVLIFFCLISCSTSKESCVVKIKESNQQVTLFFSNKMSTVSVISLPFNLNIKNTNSSRKSFRNYTYNYGNQLKGNPIKLYLNDENRLIKQSFTKIKYIEGNATNKYLIKSKHFIDTLRFDKVFFKPYILKMKDLNQDTLSIGTISQLRAKHKDLFEQLIKNDSISILFLNNKKLGERIVVPIKW